MLAFPMHILLLLEVVYQNGTSFKRCQYIVLWQLSDKCRIWSHSMNVEAMLALHASALGATVMKCTIPNSDAG